MKDKLTGEIEIDVDTKDAENQLKKLQQKIKELEVSDDVKELINKRISEAYNKNFNTDEYNQQKKFTHRVKKLRKF